MIKKLIVLFLALMMLGCSEKTMGKVTITNDIEMKSRPATMTGYAFLEEEKADFELISMKEATRLFEEGGSGILYFGKVKCRWCQRAVPELNAVALEAGIPILYVDVDVPFTQEVYDKLEPYIQETFPMDDDGNPTFYAPSVIGVKDGKLTTWHVALVKGYKPADDYTPMPDDQRRELRESYRKVVQATAD